MKRFIRYVLGITFLVLGFAGLFLPVLQGILFLIIGLLILAPESRFIRRLIARCRLKYPAVFRQAARYKRKLKEIGRRHKA
ncbi:hypothetical protein LLG96_15315 [bacterium]|nr:hypothetical protein [bacterium]